MVTVNRQKRIPVVKAAGEVEEAHLRQAGPSQSTPEPMSGTHVCLTYHPEHKTQEHISIEPKQIDPIYE